MARKWTRRAYVDQRGDSAELARRREAVLRPWPTLGYDWDALGMHLVSREALGRAEEMLRRAVWLNPFEPRFKVHLAWCLCREGRYGDAREWIEQVPGDCLPALAAEIRRLIEEGDNGRQHT